MDGNRSDVDVLDLPPLVGAGVSGTGPVLGCMVVQAPGSLACTLLATGADGAGSEC